MRTTATPATPGAVDIAAMVSETIAAIPYVSSGQETSKKNAEIEVACLSPVEGPSRILAAYLGILDFLSLTGPLMESVQEHRAPTGYCPNVLTEIERHGLDLHLYDCTRGSNK